MFRRLIDAARNRIFYVRSCEATISELKRDLLDAVTSKAKILDERDRLTVEVSVLRDELAYWRGLDADRQIAIWLRRDRQDSPGRDRELPAMSGLVEGR